VSTEKKVYRNLTEVPKTTWFMPLSLERMAIASQLEGFTTTRITRTTATASFIKTTGNPFLNPRQQGLKP